MNADGVHSGKAPLHATLCWESFQCEHRLPHGQQTIGYGHLLAHLGGADSTLLSGGAAADHNQVVAVNLHRFAGTTQT